MINSHGDSAAATPINSDLPWYRDRFLLAIIAVAALLALAYNFAIMIGFAPDESRHMSYVKLLFNEQRLPVKYPDGTETGNAHSFHPPLYYIVLLPFYALARSLPNDVTWHLVRLVSSLICVAALPMLYQIALRAGGGDVNVARFVTAQIALLPMWGMTAGTINNDSATFLAVTVFLWLLVVKYPEERSVKSAVVLGICLGLGTLCKATSLLCDGVAFIMYLLAQDGRSALRKAASWTRLAALGVCTVLIAGWWHWRSLQLYHTFTPLPPAMPPPLPSVKENGLLVALLHPNFPLLFAVANIGVLLTPWFPVLSFNINGSQAIQLQMQNGMFGTMWSQIDWIPMWLRLPLFSVLGLFCLGAVVGALRRRGIQAEELPEFITSGRIARWATYAAFVVNYVTVLQVALFFHWGWAEGGRYLLPTFCGFSIFVARGWRNLVGSRGLKLITAAWVGAFLLLNFVCLYQLIMVLNPLYGPKA